MPVLLTVGAAQVVPAVISVKVEPAGNWSLLARLLLWPVRPPAALAVSLTASSIVAGVVTMLLLATLSLAAPVVPVKVTEVVVSSAPPWVPGAV